MAVSFSAYVGTLPMFERLSLLTWFKYLGYAPSQVSSQKVPAMKSLSKALLCRLIEFMCYLDGTRGSKRYQSKAFDQAVAVFVNFFFCNFYVKLMYPL